MILVLAFVVAPVAAKEVGTIVNQGATVYIGEGGLNIEKAMEGHNIIGYWASGANLDSSSPLKTINVENRLTSFEITDSEFVGYTGNWYQVEDGGTVHHNLAFTVVDPTLDIQVWDPENGQSVNGRTIVQGRPLSFQILTNMHQVATNKRENETAVVTVQAPKASYTASISGNPTIFTIEDAEVVTFHGDASKVAVNLKANTANPSTYLWQIWNVSPIDNAPATVLYLSINPTTSQSPLVSLNGTSSSNAVYRVLLTVEDTQTHKVSKYNNTLIVPSTAGVEPYISAASAGNITFETNYIVALTDASTNAGEYDWIVNSTSSVSIPTTYANQTPHPGVVYIPYTIREPSFGSSVNLTVNSPTFNDAYNDLYGVVDDGKYKSYSNTSFTIATSGTTYSISPASSVSSTDTDIPKSSVTTYTGISLDDVDGGYDTANGYITIKVKSSNGATYSSLISNKTEASVPLTDQFVDSQPYFWGGVKKSSDIEDSDYMWKTNAISGGSYIYPQGSYTFWAESDLNNMKDNYRNAGADYTGKTISQTYTVSFTSNNLVLSQTKDTVTRGKTFAVTLTGDIYTDYVVWLHGTSEFDGISDKVDSLPPQIVTGQEGVTVGSATAGNHPYHNSHDNETVADDTPNWTGTGSPYYALVRTDSSGSATVEFTTTGKTKTQKYEIRAELLVDNTKNDEIDVTVEKGAVTIVAKGDQVYYLGEEIKFSGTNSESYTTYIFLTGPNLPSVGAKLDSEDPRNDAVDGVDSDGEHPDTFATASVNGDNTWSYNWATASVAIDAGTYTIFAESSPQDMDHLSNSTYSAVSVVINKPFVSATMSQTTVAQGDKVHVKGTAEGDPGSVQIWIFGKNYVLVDQQTVNSDTGFDYEIQEGSTKDMSTGQYFVVVQHPMQNGQFDIDIDSNNKNKVMNKQLKTTSDSKGTDIFSITGANSLQGSDAAEALVEALNSANVDDTYTKLQFLLATPQIILDPISDKHIGDKFTITGSTNLAVGDQIQIEVYSSSFKPTQKTASGAFNGATGTIPVIKGTETNNGYNTFKFDVDASTFKSDEYLVTANGIIQDATGTALFNVLDSTGISVAPTQVTTNVSPAITAVPPTPVLTAATPTPIPPATTTKSSPGFGALIALVGLGAVAFVVARRG
jgi:PGF-CTERM protein